MPFQEQLPEWNAVGVEPPASKKNIGWQAGEKPPADYWNWQMNRTYKALNELQQKALHKDDVTAADIPAEGGTNVQEEINNLKSSVSDGKAQIAAAITDKGVTTSPTDSFATMAANIEAIPVGPDTSDATATPADILSGKTAYGAAGTKMTGTMPNIGNTTVKISTLNDQTGGKGSIDSITEGGADFATNVLFRPPKGYYDGVNSKINLRFWGIKPELVKAGQKIGWTDGTAMTGTFTSDANAGAGDILSGKTAYVNGAKVTGSIPNRGAPTWTPGTSNINIPAGYYSGGTILGDPDLIPQNIRAGVEIFGVIGTLVEGIQPVHLTSNGGGHNGTNWVTHAKFTMSVSANVICSGYIYEINNNGTAYCRIHKNGVQIGPTFSTRWDSSQGRKLISVVTTVAPGDVIEFITYGEYSSSHAKVDTVTITNYVEPGTGGTTNI